MHNNSPEKKSSNNDEKKLLNNYMSLAMLQGFNLLLPLISMPYLIRVLGIDNFGLVIFSQAIIGYFNILIDFGFNLSATREVSVNRKNNKKLEEILSVVIFIKCTFILLSFLILLGITLVFPYFNQYKYLFFMTFGLVIGQALFPVWLFQGLEKMRYILVLNVISKLLITGLIFLLIKQKSDFVLVASIYSTGSILLGITSLLVIHSQFKITLNFKLLTYEAYMFYIKDSFDFFLSRLSVSIYTNSNIVLLGLLTTSQTVGEYAIAEKLYMVLRRMYQPLTNVLYPYITKTRNLLLYMKIFILANIVNFIILGILFTFSIEVITLISGIPSILTNNAFRLFLIICIVIIPSILTGYPLLAALGYKKEANNSVIKGSLFHLLGLFLLYITGNITVNNVLYLLFITETIVLTLRVISINKYKLWKIR